MSTLVISIHTSPEGSDFRMGVGGMNPIAFQSTLPLREVTETPKPYFGDIGISIHTSPEGSDFVG